MGERKKKLNFLFLTVTAANLASFTAGTAFAWSSPSLPKLNGNVKPTENPLSSPITHVEESFIASLIAIGAIFSPFIAGFSSDKLGRKRTIIISTIPLYISFVLIAFAKEVWHFYLARFFCGLSIGSLFTVLPNYVAEISEKHNRGSMSCMMVINITLGNLLIYSIGPYLPLKYSSLVCLVPPTLFFVLFPVFCPESPYYLVAKDKVKAAELSLVVLRQTSTLGVQMELVEIQTAVSESFAQKTSIIDVLKNVNLVKRLLITLGLVTFQQFSGVNAILFYLQTIFEASGSNLPSEVASIVIAISQFLSAFATPIAIERLGRKCLLYVSGFGTFVSLTAIGVFFHLKNSNGPFESITWLPIVSLIVYILSYSFGFGPVPFTVLGEIFPPHVKAIASTFTISLCFCFTFTTTVCFPYLLELVGEAQSFWFFGIFCASSLVFIAFVVPETKGKSLGEIQKMFDES